MAGKTELKFGEDDILYEKVLQESLSGMKNLADAVEQVAARKQEAVERAIKAYADAKIAAEMARKTADDAEKSKPKFGEDDVLISTEMTQ